MSAVALRHGVLRRIAHCCDVLQGFRGAGRDLFSQVVRTNQKGFSGAVGLAANTIGAGVYPFVLFSDAASTVLTGVRNDYDPSGKKQADNKYKAIPRTSQNCER